jgi:hypothetical protein
MTQTTSKIPSPWYLRHQPRCTFVINQHDTNNTFSKYFKEGTFVINLGVPSSSTKTTPTIPTFVINQDDTNNTFSKCFGEGSFVINFDVPSSSTKTTPTIPSPYLHHLTSAVPTLWQGVHH